jgi:flagellar M-ring protein FliF|nr:flagellar basal-body MS-ring/collar protein FliF [Kofleriaceae bacterium]
MPTETPSSGPAHVVRQLGEVWGRQPKGRKLAAFAVIVVVIGGVLWTSLAHHGETWVPMADGASPDDAAELYATLQSHDIPSRLKDGKIEVDASRADEARAVASAAGLPRAGKGFELFDGQSLGQSSFTEQVNFRRALQGELSRSIAALAQVESARVHIALGKRSVFKDQEEAPSASVALHLHAGQTLTADQVRGVRQMVAASVEGLKADAVAIVDNHGNLLDSAEPGAADKKVEIERGVAERVRRMLERVVGVGKVQVVATAEIDERKQTETDDIYDKDRAAVRTESRTVEGPDAFGAAASASASGVAGTRGNLPGAPASVAGGGPGSNERLQEAKTYEVSHVVRQIQNAPVQLVKLHVAVLVDDKLGPDGKPVARADKEMAELSSLAKQAAGIDATRGDELEVHAIAFAPDADGSASAADAAPPAAEGIPIEMVAAGGGAALFLIIVAALVLRRRSRNKRKHALEAQLPQLAFPTPVAELERALDAQPALDALDKPAEIPALPPGRPVHDRILDVVNSDVERAAAVLTAWLAEPPPASAAATRHAHGAK